MKRAHVVLAPSLPGLAALGAADYADLSGKGGSLAEEGRAVLLARDRWSSSWRIPLPGTPREDDEQGRLTGHPGGAGTGWVHVRRFSACSLGRALRARFGAPRSTSLAEREWNLLCHLRAYGVATPEPLAVASETAALFSPRSVLVTRELEGMQPLPLWLCEPHGAEAVRHLRRALARLLVRLHAAQVVLPDLAPHDIAVSRGALGCAPSTEPRPAEGACHSKSAGACSPQSGAAPSFAPGLRYAGSLEAALLRVEGARCVARADAESMLQLCRPLWLAAREVAPLRTREALRVFLLATRQTGLRGERRALLRRLASASTR